MNKKLTLPENEYRIKGSASFLVKVPEHTIDGLLMREGWDLKRVSSYFSDPEISYMFLVSSTKKYITFRYWLGNSQQRIRIKPEELIPHKQKDQPHEIN